MHMAQHVPSKSHHVIQSLLHRTSPWPVATCVHNSTSQLAPQEPSTYLHYAFQS